MKATGIVRRIDDLGRVVIPKEIRRTMRIREGDPLEIYTDRDGEVIFKKYSAVGEMAAFASKLCETLYKTSGFSVAISDRDTVIAAAGPVKKDILEKHISPEVEQTCESRHIYQVRSGETAIPAVAAEVGSVQEQLRAAIAAPVIVEGDITGCVMFIISAGSALPGETEYKLSAVASGFLSRQME